MLQLTVIWLAVSLVVMALLTVFVYWSGGRRHNEREQLVFDEDPDPLLIDLREQTTENGEDPPHQAKVIFGSHRSDPSQDEPAIAHTVSANSGALERLLAGVSMPCGLERLYPAGEDERIRMAFVTRDEDPKVVAVSVADELERLGMELEPLSMTEARAHRDGFELAVTIHLEPHRVVRRRRTAFPTTDANSIVIEFSVA